MTLDLDKLKALCEAATEGPWDTMGGGKSIGIVADYEPESPLGSALMIGSCWHNEAIKQDGYANAAFIKAARTALPELIAEVERLREELAKTGLELDEAQALLAGCKAMALPGWTPEEGEGHD
jgi:hypothetical protein